MLSKNTILVSLVLSSFVLITSAYAYDSDGDGVDDHLDECCATPEGLSVDQHGRPIGDHDGDCDVDLQDFAVLQTNFTGALTPCTSCNTSDDCSGDRYCARLVGGCQSAGTCNPRPLDCVDVWDPVCACDGRTYGSSCYVALSGQSVDYEGECGPPSCESNAYCDPTDFCYTCDGNCGGDGECQPRPAECMPILEPVCGCNGVSYTNPCDAARSGVNVDYDGYCLPPYCESNTDCDGAGYCAKDEGDCDGVGDCQPPPLKCQNIWDPVCACNGLTYDNGCEAARVGENIDYQGECLPSGCESNKNCNESFYCFKTVGDCNGIGECEPRPGGCVPFGPQVCGCDGVTYTDVCFAALAGVSVAHAEACGP